ncbi:MAG: TonB-dependent receptor [Candidatus Kapabacteria bacterium]|nr:TonB-dependent receptor [Candidatus Kapabacteria bacterium]
MKLLKRFSVLCYLALFVLILGYKILEAAPAPLMSENATLTGFVSDSLNGETVIGATVALKNTKYGAHTNKEGFYTIAGIPAGTYTLIVNILGYKKIEQPISFEKSENKQVSFKLSMASVTGKELLVEVDRESDKHEITLSRIDVPVKTLKQIRIGGESDIFRALQYMPGILTSSQISSGLYVRGGSPDQNLVQIDGSTVYNPSHLFGFISTFNPDAVKDVEIIKGGFPAEYGGRLSAVLNLTQKDGNNNKIEGTGSLGAISSRLSLEGPIPFDEGGTWFIGGRRTYFELIKSLLSNDPANPLPDFNFYDFNAKITQKIGQNDKLSASGFMSSDNLNYSNLGLNLGLGIKNKTGALRWNHVFSDGLFTIVNLSASNYTNQFSLDQNGFLMKVDNSINDYTLKASTEWYANENVNFKFGYELIKYNFEYLQTFKSDSGSPATNPSNIDIKAPDWTHALFAQANYHITDQLSTQTGLRVNYWKFSNIFSYDPRIALNFKINDNYTLKAAWGIYHQYLHLSAQPDFSFFDTWLPTDNTIAPAQANHYILSLETKPAEGLNFNVDVYYKDLMNITEMNQTILSADNVKGIFYTGSGHAYGAEMFLQKKYGNFYGWVGYSIGWVKAKFPDIDNGEEFYPKYDRRHDLKIVAQYKINDSWEIGGQFTFQTGQSYTAFSSRFEQGIFDSDGSRKTITVASKYNGLRLPPSHQLNLNASYTFGLVWGLQGKIILDIYNVYNRRDIWFRYADTKNGKTTMQDVKLLPIIPTISFEVKL